MIWSSLTVMAIAAPVGRWLSLNVGVPHDVAAGVPLLGGARALGLEPSQAARFEDALAGVHVPRAGCGGSVIVVDRVGQADERERR